MGVRGGRWAREDAIARLAASQRGVVTRAQLLRAGMTRNAIDNRVKSSHLHALHRGVYALGHAHLAPGAHELAAALTCGRDAVVSHRSAAWLWRLLPEPAGDPEVTVPERDCRRTGIRVHLVATLDRRDVRKLGGIPITSPARTILDLAAVVSSRELERAMAEAHARSLVRRSELVALLARAGRRPGVVALRCVLEADAEPAITRSEAEERLLGFIRAAELPAPASTFGSGATRSTSRGASRE